ncbi:MAG: hypothetical protein U0Z44_13695, partial [Kouleothrix sp.]
MLRWKPQLGPGRWIALALLLVMVCGIVAVGWQLAPMFRGSPENWQIDLGTYGRVLVLLALVWLAGALAYRTAAAFTLSYELDRNGL